MRRLLDGNRAGPRRVAAVIEPTTALVPELAKPRRAANRPRRVRGMAGALARSLATARVRLPATPRAARAAWRATLSKPPERAGPDRPSLRGERAARGEETRGRCCSAGVRWRSGWSGAGSCVSAEAFQIATEIRAFLTNRGVMLSGDQQAKTTTVLEYFSRNLAAMAWPEPARSPISLPGSARSRVGSAWSSDTSDESDR